VKLDAAANSERFEAEADALRALRDSEALTVPTVYCHGSVGGTAFLFLEWLELGAASASAENTLGHLLAHQHRITATSFGWPRDNFIGMGVQPNAPSNDWISFVRDQRLGYQLDLAAKNGLPEADREAGTAILNGLEGFFDDAVITPSLLHGDLWSGNWGVLAADVPCIFDPAVYFGDREADLAMTRLFGGFGHAFYEAYTEAWPLREGWEHRVDLYNLYHLLNHFNIFGGSYLSQISVALSRLRKIC
jgi:fructosamine-3-kinase